MRVQSTLTNIAGSCNFCDKGKLSESGCDLVYPYKTVYEIEARGITVRLCKGCLKDLGKIINDILNEIK